MQKEFNSIVYRTGRDTQDPDAIEVNKLTNEVTMAITTGRRLAQIYRDRFKGNRKNFIEWVKINLDRDPSTCKRWMCLARASDLMQRLRVIALTGAYRLVGIRDCVLMSDPVWDALLEDDQNTEN